MAAPTATVRPVPTVQAMHDGYRSLLTFSLNPAIWLWERRITPSGRDGGEPIPYSSMHSNVFHSFRPRSLQKGTDLVMICGYDPRVFAGQGTYSLDGMINKDQAITQFFPQGSWIAFYGWLRSAIFNEHAEGNPPEVTITVTPSFWDANAQVQAGPAYGTATITGSGFTL